ncbi:hypothetical protein [Oenococcus oeni]|uniref:Uncharacterized protein n=3 Tax=Oenococcus oeni TaxID=1247 RepID=Q04FX2_OENOB|nr:hypothetical protein [Oenococcus oeni]ABJ56650.1 hypothetical protein OEOE_0716 [Oenococcus oeni PSU-1]EFD88789.1 hypothetical protein AWRIB429_0671 [Oenococcus oeni AWRIB429]EJN92744.1 hypothetical protein AWRIB304_437 [Oenococcus oeni AWRIB304]EJO00105.1 hypothetical protein AWRIB418_1314 [Oenococcus oeni AWRIB418]EJO01945.1 hypothetical protein AWRIB419_379 [Oenococcus oeni AWRIB419]
MPLKNNKSKKQGQIKKTIKETKEILSNAKDLAEDRAEDIKKNLNNEDDEESKKQKK